MSARIPASGPRRTSDAGIRWRTTLSNCNLTGSRAQAASSKPRGSEGRYRVSDRRTADYGNAAAEAVAPARPVRQAVAADHSAGDDRGSPDLRARDRQFPDEPAERPAGGGQHRGAGAGCGALRHGSGFAGAADPRQHRRACGGHQDGPAAPAAGQRRSAAGDRPRRRHARR